MTKHHSSGHSPDQDYVPAAGHDRYLPFYDLFSAVFGVGRVHRRLVEQAGLADGQRVLEIGCGTGNLLRRARQAQPGCHLIGLDPDPRALQRTRRKLPDLELVQGYSQRLPFEDASFDRVLSAFMFHHLDTGIQRRTAAEVRRVLRPGGSLHLVDIVGEPHGLSHSRRARATFAQTAEQLPELLRAEGLDPTTVTIRRHRPIGNLGYYRATGR